MSRQLLEAGYAIPMVENVTVAATGQNVHGFAFDPTARQRHYDTWIDA